MVYRIRAFTKIMLLAIGLGVAAAPGLGIVPWAHAQGQGSSLLQATERAYLHTVWTTEDGLPQNSVNAIVQTRDGYLWLATFGGLVRFDGVAFTVFDVASVPGLASNRMVSLYEDRAGVLWIGHETGEVNRYEDGIFTSYGVDDGLPGQSIYAFAEDQDGGLWIGTRGGVVRFANGVFTTYTTADGLPNNWVYNLLVDRTGRLWIATDAGLACFEEGRFTVYTMADGLPSNAVGELFEDRGGRLWVGAAGGLVYYHDGGFVPFSPVDHQLRLIKAIVADRDGDLWVGKGAPHQLLRFASATTTPGNALVVTANVSVDRIIQSIFEDREGNLWVGTDGGGLHRIREKPVLRYSTRSGLVQNSVFRVIADGKGGVWFNAGCDNLTRFHAGSFTAYATLPGGGKVGCVWAMLWDQAETFWIGSDNGLVRWEGDRYTRI